LVLPAPEANTGSACRPHAEKGTHHVASRLAPAKASTQLRPGQPTPAVSRSPSRTPREYAWQMTAELETMMCAIKPCDRPVPRNPHHCFHPASGLKLHAEFTPVRGRRLVLYDAEGDFDRSFDWWTKDSGEHCCVKPHLPFENGRTDLLTGSGTFGGALAPASMSSGIVSQLSRSFGCPRARWSSASGANSRTRAIYVSPNGDRWRTRHNFGG
jgi:hypothetical protein